MLLSIGHRLTIYKNSEIKIWVHVMNSLAPVGQLLPACSVALQCPASDCRPAQSLSSVQHTTAGLISHSPVSSIRLPACSATLSIRLPACSATLQCQAYDCRPAQPLSAYDCRTQRSNRRATQTTMHIHILENRVSQQKVCLYNV